MATNEICGKEGKSCCGETPCCTSAAVVRTDKEEMVAMAVDSIRVHCANRDGDLFYIECPDCHCVDLKAKRMMMCRECGQHFSLYFEDGHKSFDIKKLGKTFSGDKEFDIIKLDSNDWHWYVPYPRHNVESMQPAEIKILRRDLNGGEDAHGHERYRRYALIPLD